jgi:hypothetical protein
MRIVAHVVSCKGQGIKKNQDVVISWLKERDIFKVLATTRLPAPPKAGGVEVTFPERVSQVLQTQKQSRKAQKGNLIVEMDVLCREGGSDPRLLAFYEANILLAFNLCMGSTDARKMIRKLISYDALLKCVDNEAIPLQLRSHFTSLMHHLYVEQAKIYYLSLSHNTQLLGEIDSNAGKLPSPLFDPDKELGHYRSLKKALIAFLSNCNGKEGFEPRPGMHQMILSSCRLCNQLLRLGFFSADEDIRNILLPPLFALLTRDLDHHSICSSDTSAESGYIVEYKLEICQILDFICDLRMRVRLVRLLAIFKNSFMSNKNTKQGWETSKLVEKMKHNNRDEIEKVLGYLAFSSSGVEGDRLTRALVDLMRHRSTELAVASLRLLIRDMSPRLELFKEIKCTQILIDPAAISAFKQCQGHSALLQMHFSAVKHIMSSLSEEDRFPPEARQSVLNAIEECGKLCCPSPNGSSKDSRELANENKETVRRSGIHQLVLDIIRSAFEPFGDRNGHFILRVDQASSQYTSREKGIIDWRRGLLKHCFTFIEQFCSESEVNQNIIAPDALLLVACMNNHLNVIKTVSAIFKSNQKLCEHIDERVIISVMNILAGKVKGHRVDPRRKPHYLVFLGMLCKVGDTVISRNQVYITKYLSDNGPLKLHSDGGHGHVGQERSEDALVLFRGKAGEALREQLFLASKDAAKPEHELLQYNEALLKLLEVLLLNHVPEVCALVRVMLPPEKIRDDIKSPHCRPQAKGELLNLMGQLYLSEQVTRRHPLLIESLWDMMEYEALELKLLPTETFSRYSQEPSARQAQQLLFSNWCPVLLSIFSSKSIMRNISDQKKTAANDLLDRLIEITNQCALDQVNFMKLYRIYQAAKDHQISGASILSEKAAESAKAVTSAPGDAVVSAPAPGAANAGDDSQNIKQSVDLFAQVFIEALDPFWRSSQHQGGLAGADYTDTQGEGHDDDIHQVVRTELWALSRVFVNSSPIPARQGQPAAARGSAGPVSLLEFRADLAGYLIDLLVKYDSSMHSNRDTDVLVCLRVLKVLVLEWRASATAVQPPAWLLEGIPRVVTHLLSSAQSSDSVVLCSIELGIVALHGGNKVMQLSFLSTLTAQGSNEMFLQLRKRIQRAETEARIKYQHFREVLDGRVAPEPLVPSRGLHSLVARSVSSVQVADSPHVDKVFRFVQLLVEGQNMQLQEYLRNQPECTNSVDLISASASCVDAVTPYLSPWSVIVATKAMNALAESVMNPCRANQRLLVDTKLCACANEILDMRAEAVEGLEVDYEQLVNELKAATVGALLSLLECVNDNYIPDRMLASLNMSILIDNMNFYLASYNPDKLLEMKRQLENKEVAVHNQKQLLDMLDALPAPCEESGALVGDSWREEAAGDEERRESAEQVARFLYIIFKTLSGYETSGRLQRLCQREFIWDLERLQEKVGVIEISRKGVLEKVYFVIPDVCQYLTELSKEDIKVNVNRANLQTSLADFTSRFDSLYSEMKHQQRLKQSRVLGLFHATHYYREKLFFYNALAINLVLLVGYAYQCNGTFKCGDHEALTDYRLMPGAKELSQVPPPPPPPQTLPCVPSE